MSPVDGMGECISQRQNMMFESTSKSEYESLGSRISSTFTSSDNAQCVKRLRKGLFYINAYGIEIHPSSNPEYLSALSSKEVLVYSCGSLWTRCDDFPGLDESLGSPRSTINLDSIIPCLALRGVAAGIARSSTLRAKILLLNAANDRETEGYTAADYIHAMTRTLNGTYQSQPYGLGNANTTYPISAFLTHMIYLTDTSVKVDVGRITGLGVKCVEIAGTNGHTTSFNAELVERAIQHILAEV
ncbi:hypothetical protein H0H87_010238 [Tephrocybe sp. NHM501043]|nr:hypothetical protein H0H87_010238 [Tephrocybe sp. NHM501043]